MKNIDGRERACAVHTRGRKEAFHAHMITPLRTKLRRDHPKWCTYRT